MKQVLLTTSAGKRLIGKAMAAHPEIKSKLSRGTIVITAGTTNGYVEEEVLAITGEASAFRRDRFFRGVTLPPGYETGGSSRVLDRSGLQGDMVIRDGVWDKGKSLADVAPDLEEGDVILKGANALDLYHRRAAVLVGNSTGGTIVHVIRSLAGRRTRVIIPVGLEKRVPGDLDSLAGRINAPGSRGPRLVPLPGEIFTEIEALFLLSGATAELFAAGGICGAEGSVRLLVSGTPEQEEAAEKTVASVSLEPPFSQVVPGI